MGIEIERKFRVSDTSQHAEWRSGEPLRLSQGYLANSESSVVRVRVRDHESVGDASSIEGARDEIRQQAWITVKGPTVGASRPEYEYKIPPTEASEMLRLLCEGVVEKTRYVIEHGGKLWEVDEFYGTNQGLIVAEIELESEDDEFDVPDWVGVEVTNDARYYNSNLSLHPFQDWTDRPA